MMKERFDCCYELEHKGIFFDAKSNGTHFAISMFNGSKFQTEVCLQDAEVEKLRDMLNEHLARKQK